MNNKVTISMQFPDENWERKVSWDIPMEDILALDNEDWERMLKEMRDQLNEAIEWPNK